MLISVKNLIEANLAAITAGVSIIDVKDPSQGSLGFAGPTAVNDIAESVKHAGAKPVSVALGELHHISMKEVELVDWTMIDFVKVGLSRCYQDENWRRPLTEVFAAIPPQVARVLVTYADEVDAETSMKLLPAALADGMTVVLIDTFDKSQGNVFRHWTEANCKDLFTAASKLAMKTVLAGSIRKSDVAKACQTNADLIGVRGAVCDGDRKADLSPQLLEDFLEAYRNVVTSSRPTPSCQSVSEPA